MCAVDSKRGAAILLNAHSRGERSLEGPTHAVSIVSRNQMFQVGRPYRLAPAM